MLYRTCNKYLVGFLLSILIVSCNKCSTEEKEQELVKLKPTWKVKNTLLKDAIEEEYSLYLKDTNTSEYFDTLYAHYSGSKFKSIWKPAFDNKENFNTLLSFFRNYALEEGLAPSWYLIDSLEKIKTQVFSNEKPDYALLGHAERLISENILTFHKDHVFGRTNPKELFGKIYMLPKRKVEGFELMKVLDYENVGVELKRNEIDHDSYIWYKELLASWNRLKTDSSVDWSEIDFGNLKKLVPDSSTTLMPQIAAKLVQMGIITQEETLLADSSKYNRSFAPMIKRAQTSFGLMDDGVLGRKTFKIINTTIDSRIEDIRVNMERVRWFIPDSTKKCIWVNIPDYTLVANYIDSVRKIKVAVGKPRPHDYDKQMEKYKETGKWYHRPKDHSTPQIYGKVKYMVVNPTWTVPASIVRREMYWQMRRDSSYLSRNNYRVYDGKTELFPDTIKWYKYKPTNIPFRFVQKEGESNALGKVKYIFHNPFSIYLHDTPQKKKFEWTERAVSHGCVRVAEPFQVAEFLLQGNEKVNYDDFRIKLGMEPLEEERLEEWDPLDTLAEIQPIDSTEIIYLHERVPIYFLYSTIFFTEEKSPVFRNDVYGYNRRVYAAMRKRHKE